MKRISIPEPVMLVFSAPETPPSVEGLGMRYSADVSEADQSREDTKDDRRGVGLCFDCLHSQRIQSARGSRFYRCTLSDSDLSFPKYPGLPVVYCPGYIQKVEKS